MINSHNLVPILLNARLEDIPVDYLGPKPLSTFVPVEPTELFVNLVRQTLGTQPHAVAYQACKLLEVARNSHLGGAIRPVKLSVPVESQHLRQMLSSLSPLVTTPDAAEFSTSQPKIHAAEFNRLVFRFQRLSANTFSVATGSRVATTVPETSPNLYSYRISGFDDTAITFKPFADSFVMQWSTTPNRLVDEVFSAVRDTQTPALRLLSNSEQHTLPQEIRRGVSSIMFSSESGPLAPAAFLLLIISHYEYLHNLRL